MKTSKKIIALVMALIMLVSLMPVNAFATSLTINNNSTTEASARRTYGAYELFKIVKSGTDAAPVYTYTFADARVKNYFTANASKYGITGTEDDTVMIGKIVETLSGYSNDDANMKTLAADMYEMAITLTKNSDLSNLPEDGYYFIVDEGNLDPRSRNIIVPVIGEAEIEVKADKIPFKKELVDTTDKTATVGDEVEFKITSKVPDTTGFKNTAEKPYKFTITDSMRNLEYKANSLKVKIDGREIDLSNFEYTANGSSLEIKLGNYIYRNNATLVGKNIEVTYTAIVTAAAANTNTAENDASLVYTTNPNTGADGEEDTSVVDLYNFNINLAKTSVLGTALQGATFKLKYGQKYITATQSGNAYNVTGFVDGADNATVFTAGNVTIKGLGDGDYTLEEITAPNGYGIASGLTFKINATDSATALEGTVVKGDNASGFITATGTVTITKATADNQNATTEGTMDVTVLNSKATLLPSTGGIGTTIFTVVGIGVMVAAVVAFVVVNKKNK